MTTTPLAERTRIVLFGLRNAGKSSLMNAIFEKEVAIVSDQPGTTTDPVTRAYELIGAGPVAFTDTAGLDDEGPLGSIRIERAKKALAQADIALLVTPLTRPPHPLEDRLLEEVRRRGIPYLVAASFADQAPDPAKEAWLASLPHVRVASPSREGVRTLTSRLVHLVASLAPEPTPLEGLVREGDLLVLVVPIDLAAPKGRLILPQVETLRDALDRDCAALVVKERELSLFFPRLPHRPRLVITDSQAFHKVAADIPPDQPLTSFSILFARKKGDLARYVRGLAALTAFPEGKRVLVVEACSHHRQPDDIATVKIPRLFHQLVDPAVPFDHARELPEDLSPYGLVIHCGGCMVTRRAVLARLDRLAEAGVPVTNYGLFLAWAHGLLPRALEPFPYEYELYCTEVGGGVETRI
ncbi:[FeFe] hydrogenase H-cluster maturation GTPase HydF [Spirochaeta thermophila]|uniref:[FeFe] hydrogenase H-cluster maturation GTPase HydF n=1 Tax=Winmispira thermophila TaxID=154 RepID=UPI000309A0C2|nr:[FeFe] hydrogenase H-cluster maturation GTPase HydF [Spirochaeta thermophila]